MPVLSRNTVVEVCRLVAGLYPVVSAEDYRRILSTYINSAQTVIIPASGLRLWNTNYSSGDDISYVFVI